jgi:hypothetical protein
MDEHRHVVNFDIRVRIDAHKYVSSRWQRIGNAGVSLVIDLKGSSKLAFSTIHE